MSIRVPFLLATIVSAAYVGTALSVQESPSIAPVPIAPELPSLVPAADPPEPATLLAPPTFGDSGPTSPALNHKDEAGEPDKPIADETKRDPKTAEDSAEWKPKFIVSLQTKRLDQGDKYVTREVTVYRKVGDKFVAEQRTERALANINLGQAAMRCDDIKLDGMINDDGAQTYNFSCTGKASLTIAGNRVSGDSVTSVDGTIVISHATVEMPDGTKLRSEKITLSLPIFGLSVGTVETGETQSESGTFKAGDFYSPGEFIPNTTQKLVPTVRTPIADPAFFEEPATFKPSGPK
jgi:hypothetical protein